MESLLLASISFIGAEVARKVSDDAMSRAWALLQSLWVRSFGESPEPADISSEKLALLHEELDLAGWVASALPNSPLLARLKRVGDVLSGARILWIDDHPEWNQWEIRFLETVGAKVRTVETTSSALALASSGFDLVISDIARQDNPMAGLEALPMLHAGAPSVRVLFYVGSTAGKSTPLGAFGIADRPDDLIHLILDALERTRI